MIPRIRLGLTPDGDIEAAVNDHNRNLRHVVIDRRTGKVLHSTVTEGTAMFRYLVTAARQHVAN